MLCAGNFIDDSSMEFSQSCCIHFNNSQTESRSSIEAKFFLLNTIFRLANTSLLLSFWTNLFCILVPFPLEGCYVYVSQILICIGSKCCVLWKLSGLLEDDEFCYCWHGISFCLTPLGIFRANITQLGPAPTYPNGWDDFKVSLFFGCYWIRISGSSDGSLICPSTSRSTYWKTWEIGKLQVLCHSLGRLHWNAVCSNVSNCM